MAIYKSALAPVGLFVRRSERKACEVKGGRVPVVGGKVGILSTLP